ncbi:hypothetical protein [Rubrobacter xylanophilus]|uniref:hypothetical protein n=1 Tax=Rubrobacter xylanophilus TaxID=49319 RepID=UPI001179B9B0|nr:hypothetical protein [Rubrobacter xylanophilus]
MRRSWRESRLFSYSSPQRSSSARTVPSGEPASAANTSKSASESPVARCGSRLSRAPRRERCAGSCPRPWPAAP